LVPKNFDERCSDCCDEDFVTRDAQLIKSTERDVATVTMRYHDLGRTEIVGLLSAYVFN
jgi:hypothetical protein